MGLNIALYLSVDRSDVHVYDIEEHLEVVEHRSLIVSLVMVLGVCPVCPAAAVFISSVLPTRGTI